MTKMKPKTRQYISEVSREINIYNQGRLGLKGEISIDQATRKKIPKINTNLV